MEFAGAYRTLNPIARIATGKDRPYACRSGVSSVDWLDLPCRPRVFRSRFARGAASELARDLTLALSAMSAPFRAVEALQFPWRPRFDVSYPTGGRTGWRTELSRALLTACRSAVR